MKHSVSPVVDGHVCGMRSGYPLVSFVACFVFECFIPEAYVQVIKMPHSQKQSEDKEKMAFMEYAISGILLHNNIVQVCC